MKDFSINFKLTTSPLENWERIEKSIKEAQASGGDLADPLYLHNLQCIYMQGAADFLDISRRLHDDPALSPEQAFAHLQKAADEIRNFFNPVTLAVRREKAKAESTRQALESIRNTLSADFADSLGTLSEEEEELLPKNKLH